MLPLLPMPFPKRSDLPAEPDAAADNSPLDSESLVPRPSCMAPLPRSPLGDELHASLRCSLPCALAACGVLLLAAVNYVVMPPLPVPPPAGPVGAAERPLCTGADYLDGQWRRVRLEAPDEATFRNATGYRCAYYSPFHCFVPPEFPASRLQHDRTLQQAVDIARWRWEPTACTLPRFDAPEFVRMLGNRSILLVGDVTSAEMYDSLRCQLAPYAHRLASAPALDIRDPASFGERTLEANRSLFPLVIAATGGTIGYAPVREAALGLGPWRLQWFDIVVVGLAAHAKAPLLEATLGALGQALQQSNFSGHLLWRTLHRTVPDCANYARPALSPEESPAREWADADRKEATALRLLSLALGRPLTVLYANMTDLRWDAAARTGDCLRSCLPGPVDVWNRLLYLSLLRWERQRPGPPPPTAVEDRDWEPEMDAT